jgi:hypothetical protein
MFYYNNSQIWEIKLDIKFFLLIRGWGRGFGGKGSAAPAPCPKKLPHLRRIFWFVGLYSSGKLFNVD